MKRFLTPFLFLFALIFISACTRPGFEATYGIFSVKNDTTAYMNGTIGSRTDTQFDKLIKNYPNIKLLVLQDCPGSKDDVTNLAVSRQIYDLGIDTQLDATSIIASGAVDLFLAGTQRTIATGAQIGVHSWAEGSTEANEFPVGHEKHLPYIEYYKYVGFSQDDAEAFYYFTINAAPAAEVHWMTEEEIATYGMAK